MSFSDNVKSEIIKNSELLDKNALRCGMVRGDISLTLDKGKMGCVITTLDVDTALFLMNLLDGYDADLTPEQKKGLNPHKVFNIILSGRKAEKLLVDCGIMEQKNNALEYVGECVPREKLLSESEKRGYVAGVFLTSGSVFIPKSEEGQSTYQLEFNFTSGGYADSFASFLGELGFMGKVVERKELPVLYFKESEVISDLLAYMGAVDAVLEVQNVKVYRSVRNNENRISNCLIANIDKSVNAAQRQINAIELLIEEDKFNLLDQKLKDVAEVRISNPEDSLDSLAERLGLSKSCINHRLRKLEAISRGEE